MSIKRFLTNCEGGVAPMLALAALPMFGFVGAGVDFSRASSARTAMQAALDATALILARDGQQSGNAQLSEIGTSYFNANFSHPDVTISQVSISVASNSNGTTATLSARGSVKTEFMNILGFSLLNVAVNSSAIANADGLGCVLSLNPQKSGSITDQGSASVNLKNCSMYDNSNNSSALIVAGCALQALSVVLFLNPADLASGGVTGLAIILNRVLPAPIPVGIVTLVLNLPLFALGLKKLGGWKFLEIGRAHV